MYDVYWVTNCTSLSGNSENPRKIQELEKRPKSVKQG